MYYKGIVIDKLTNSYTVLTNDNRYIKIRNNYQAEIGQKITFLHEDIVIKKQVSNVYKYGLVAALFMVVFLTFNQLYFNTSEAMAVVSIDINPSIELFIDADKKVIDIIALNDEGNELINESFKGLSIDTVIDSIVKEAQNLKYLRADNNQVLITKTNLNKEDLDIENDILATLKKDDDLVGVKLIYIEVKPEIVERAKQNNQSIGIYTINNEQVEKLTYKEVPIYPGNSTHIENKEVSNNKSQETDKSNIRNEVKKQEIEQKQNQKQEEKNDKEEEKETVKEQRKQDIEEKQNENEEQRNNKKQEKKQANEEKHNEKEIEKDKKQQEKNNKEVEQNGNSDELEDANEEKEQEDYEQDTDDNTKKQVKDDNADQKKKNNNVEDESENEKKNQAEDQEEDDEEDDDEDDDDKDDEIDDQDHHEDDDKGNDKDDDKIEGNKR